MSAFQHLTIHCNDRVYPLPHPQLWAFFDAVKRVFGCAAKHRKDRDIAKAGNPVIAPFARGDHASIQRQDHRKFGSVKGNLFGSFGAKGRGGLHIHATRLAANRLQIKRCPEFAAKEPAKRAGWTQQAPSLSAIHTASEAKASFLAARSTAPTQPASPEPYPQLSRTTLSLSSRVMFSRSGK